MPPSSPALLLLQFRLEHQMVHKAGMPEGQMSVPQGTAEVRTGVLVLVEIVGFEIVDVVVAHVDVEGFVAVYESGEQHKGP